MAVKLSDIAKKAQVSLSTASWVLNGRADEFRISQATCERVIRTSQELNYRPSFSAKSLAKGRTYTIGFQCGNIQSPYYSEMATLAMQEAEARGYHLTIQVTQWKAFGNDLKCLESLLNRGVEGVIFFGAALQPGTSLHDYLVQKRFPLIQLNDRSPDLAWVVSDYRPGMNAAVEHFQQKGFDRIGYIKSKGMIGYKDDKELALAEACRRRNVEMVTFLSDVEDATPRMAGVDFAKNSKRTRAIITTSDQMAIGFIRGLRDEGFDVPKDFSIIGIDGTTICEYLQPRLSTIAHDKEAIMKHAVNTVISMIEDKEVLAENLMFPTKLILREST